MLLLGVIKAFDRVPRVYLWATTRKSGVPEKMILVLQGLHANMTAEMIVDGVVKGLDMPQGTGQGSTLGPRLFAFFMLAILDLLHDRLTETNDTSGLSCALDDKMTGRPIGTKGEWTPQPSFCQWGLLNRSQPLPAAVWPPNANKRVSRPP